MDYNCPNCNKEIRLGNSYCPNCETKLVWPNKHCKRFVKLRINPLLVDSFYEKRRWYTYGTILLSLFWPVTSTIFLIQYLAIGKWLKYVIDPVNNKKIATSKVIKNINTIRYAALITAILNALYCIVAVVLVAISISNNETMTFRFVDLLRLIIGIIVLLILERKAANIVRDQTQGKKYTFDRNTQKVKEAR